MISAFIVYTSGGIVASVNFLLALINIFADDAVSVLAFNAFALEAGLALTVIPAGHVHAHRVGVTPMFSSLALVDIFLAKDTFVTSSATARVRSLTLATVLAG
jgi:hypothetical protein